LETRFVEACRCLRVDVGMSAAAAQARKDEAKSGTTAPKGSSTTDTKQRLKPPPKAAPAQATGGGGGKTSSKAPGLSDEATATAAQVKLEWQEDKLKDVAKPAMALLRDFKKLSATDCSKKVLDIRKALVQYELKCIRMWELQEKVSQSEIQVLHVRAEENKKEAEEEVSVVPGLQAELEKSSQRLKRHQDYETLAMEVNRKKPRKETQGEIAAVNTSIEQLRQQQSELEDMVERRNQRAQLLRHAIEELKQDLQLERSKGGEAPGAQGKEGGGAGEGSKGGASFPAIGTVFATSSVPEVEVVS